MRRCTLAGLVLGTLLVAGCSGSSDATPQVSVTAAPTDSATTVEVPPSETETTATDPPGTLSEPAETDAPTTTELEADFVQPEIDVIDSPNSGGEFVGARGDIVDEGCDLVDDAWRYTGVATNSSSAIADYRIYVAFLDPAGDTIGLVQTNVDQLAPAATADVEATIVADGRPVTQCVLRVERYDQ